MKLKFDIEDIKKANSLDIVKKIADFDNASYKSMSTMSESWYEMKDMCITLWDARKQLEDELCERLSIDHVPQFPFFTDNRFREINRLKPNNFSNLSSLCKEWDETHMGIENSIWR